jgi:hypothetical protein
MACSRKSRRDVNQRATHDAFISATATKGTATRLDGWNGQCIGDTLKTQCKKPPPSKPWQQHPPNPIRHGFERTSVVDVGRVKLGM